MTQADARVAAARRAAVLAVGAAEVRVVSVPVPALGDLPARAGRGARAAAEARSADARRALPRGAGASSSARCKPTVGCRSPTPRLPDALATLDRDRRARRRRLRRTSSRPPSIASGATRSPTSPRTCASGCAGCRRAPATGSPSTSSSASASERRGPRSAQRCRTRCSSTAVPLRGSVDLIEQQARRDDRCGSPITRPARTGRPGRRSSAAARMLQPVLYSLAVEQALGTPVHVRAPVLLHGRRAASPITRSRSTSEPRDTGSKRWRSSTAPSSSASCRPRPQSARAPGATSARSAAPTKSSAWPTRSPEKLGDLDALREKP